MPVTKTARRALRVSHRKKAVNDKTRETLEIALRHAKKEKTVKSITTAISQADRAAKKHVIHKNKAARIKSALSKLASKPSAEVKKSKASKPQAKKSSSKKK